LVGSFGVGIVAALALTSCLGSPAAEGDQRSVLEDLEVQRLADGLDDRALCSGPTIWKGTTTHTCAIPSAGSEPEVVARLASVAAARGGWERGSRSGELVVYTRTEARSGRSVAVELSLSRPGGGDYRLMVRLT
jgi:hypothetical protein